MTATIDKHIPIPTSKKNRRHLENFVSMEVGDSFKFDGGQSTGCVLCSYHSRKMGKKFICRKYEDHVRIWRIE